MNDSSFRKSHWDSLRWRFVFGLIQFAKHDIPTGSQPVCDDRECCQTLAELMGRMGLQESFWKGLEYTDQCQRLVRPVMRDALGVLDIIHQYGQAAISDPLRGFMEAPEIVIRIIDSDHFRKLKNVDPQFDREGNLKFVDDYRIELLFALTTAAFPNRFLERLETSPAKLQDDSLRAERNIGSKRQPMIDDGYYVSLFDDDASWDGQPRAIVVVQDGVVTICPNKKSTADASWLTDLAKRLQELDPKSDDYADEAIALEGFWAFNGYSPNPSMFIAPHDYDGRFDKLINEWRIS